MTGQEHLIVIGLADGLIMIAYLAFATRFVNSALRGYLRDHAQNAMDHREHLVNEFNILREYAEARMESAEDDRREEASTLGDQMKAYVDAEIKKMARASLHVTTELERLKVATKDAPTLKLCVEMATKRADDDRHIINALLGHVAGASQAGQAGKSARKP